MSAQSGHSSRHLHRYNPAAPSHRPSTLSELEVLQRNHRFIRDEDDGIAAHTWEEQLSLSWYNKLFREYALCDLTQYKSGGVALRWRIEQEVLDRLGEVGPALHRECTHTLSVYLHLPSCPCSNSSLAGPSNASTTSPSTPLAMTTMATSHRLSQRTSHPTSSTFDTRKEGRSSRLS